MALTQAIAEHIHDRIGARTLISTHYHELTQLPDYLPKARNYRTEVAEHRGRISFLYTVVPGGADRSYGINVARMAGIPAEVIQRHGGFCTSWSKASRGRNSSICLQLPPNRQQPTRTLLPNSSRTKLSPSCGASIFHA